MKLATALAMAAFVLVPAVAFAEEPGNAKNEPGVIQKAIGAMTGRSSNEKQSPQGGSAQSGNKETNAQNAGSTNYPDFGVIKKTGK
ncbi:MAG: hypothetical protein ACT4O2_08930 [Beijerinckiaceae bacterium]